MSTETTFTIVFQSCHSSGTVLQQFSGVTATRKIDGEGEQWTFQAPLSLLRDPDVGDRIIPTNATDRRPRTVSNAEATSDNSWTCTTPTLPPKA